MGDHHPAIMPIIIIPKPKKKTLAAGVWLGGSDAHPPSPPPHVCVTLSDLTSSILTYVRRSPSNGLHQEYMYCISEAWGKITNNSTGHTALTIEGHTISQEVYSPVRVAHHV